MYAIAKNVVRPAKISVFTVVPFSLSLNSFSKIIIAPFHNNPSRQKAAFIYILQQNIRANINKWEIIYV